MDTIRLDDATVVTQKADPAQDGSDADGVLEDPMDRRGAERATIECPVTFISEERHSDGSKVEGKLRDLSKTGCQIFSLYPPAPGSQITLLLPLPDGQPPMLLIGTKVRRVQGRAFGAEFLPLTPQERRRLQTIIFKYLTWSPYSLRRPAFRIA